MGVIVGLVTLSNFARYANKEPSWIVSAPQDKEPSHQRTIASSGSFLLTSIKVQYPSKSIIIEDIDYLPSLEA